MKIKVNYHLISINGFEIEGHIDENLHCKKCKFEYLIYSDSYDAYFCPKCNEWTESACDDPHCKYCANRPERPIPV